MPSINNQPVLPGVYDQVQQQLLASVTGGIRVTAFIGTGRLTNLVTGEAVTRGSGNTDVLAHKAVALDGTTITDANYATYENGIDYILGFAFTVTTVTDSTHLVVASTTGMTAGDTITQINNAGTFTTTITTVTDSTHLVVGSTTNWVAGEAVDVSVGDITWLSLAASLTGTASDPYTSLSGLNFQLSVAGGPIQTIPFTTETTAAEVAATMNAYFSAHTIAAIASATEVSVPALASASTYAVIASSTITNTGSTTLTGNVALSPAGSITGSPTVVGTTNNGNSAAATALADATTAYTAFQNLTGATVLTGDLGGRTLTAGVYKFASSAALTGTLTLDGQGNPDAQWVFQIGSTLVTATAAIVTMINSGNAGNVYWQVGSSATLGTATQFKGTILAQASVTDDGGSTIMGRLFALTAAVTLNNTTDTVVAGSSAPGTLVISTTGTSNSSLTVENGTANAILGFVAGSLVSTPSRPVAGVVYYPNYEWAKALGDGQNSFQPQFFFTQNFTTITNAMGTVGGGDSQTANMNGAWTLPIAAQLAQQNGASIVCLMQMNPADGSNASQVRAALQKLFIPNINIVVSLDAADNAMLIPDITAHVETASSTINRLERTAFIGFAANDPSFTNMTTMLGYATAASSNRVVVVNQTSTTDSMFIGTNQTASTVDGTMMASALAALRTNPAFDVAQPLTREVVTGITTTNTLAQAQKVILSNAGVLIVDNISGSAKVVFGTTTEFDTILNQLYQVTEITDYTAQTLRGLLDPIFIGQKLLSNTPSQVETVSGAILQTIEDADIIESFVQPTATVNPLQPTQILLQVGIQPVLELDTILITLGLNLV
jgi:hypothetical protein